VRHNPDIARVFEFECASHGPLTSLLFSRSNYSCFCHKNLNFLLPEICVTYVLLPAIMRECFVRFGHAVNVFLLLDRSAACVCRVNQFIRQLVNHRLAGPIARIL
jgi:hypothetical protein